LDTESKAAPGRQGDPDSQPAGKIARRALLFIGKPDPEVKAMATNTQVETVSTGADKAKLAATAVLVVGSVVAFYLLGQQSLWLRVAALLIGLVAAVAIYFSSESGKRLIAYGRESVREVKKVVWPTRKEAGQMTAYVFAFVVLMALFLWLTDKTLEWLLYDLILGWKR
jgi:preprotein translocase subunit SecE